MDMYNETIDLARFTTKIFLPLHRKIRNLYRQKKDLQSQIRKLRIELHSFKDDLAQRNINVLAQAATKISTRLRR